MIIFVLVMMLLAFAPLDGYHLSLSLFFDDNDSGGSLFCGQTIGSRQLCDLLEIATGNGRGTNILAGSIGLKEDSNS